MTELARCGELRSLELEWVAELEHEDLATGLAGCVRLERLVIKRRRDPVSHCLPPAGLPALRRLELFNCDLLDSDLQQLVLRLPNLQSVILEYCTHSTEHDVAQLGKLSDLTYLRLMAHLRTTRLTELWLDDDVPSSAVSVTAQGLLMLTQRCPCLREIALLYDDKVMERTKCGPGTDNERLLEFFRRYGLR